MKKPLTLFTLLALFVLIIAGFSAAASARSRMSEGDQPGPAIRLSSRIFVPEPGIDIAAQELKTQSIGTTHLLIQFDGVVTEAQRAILQENGVTLLGYIPEDAWLAAVTGPVDLAASKFSFIRWAGSLQAADKISPALRKLDVGKWAIDAQGRVSLRVLFFADVDPESAVQALTRLGGTVLQSGANVFVAQFPSEVAIEALAALDQVQWIDNGPAPRYERSVSTTTLGPNNDVSRDHTNVNALQTAHSDAIGTGVVVGVWDGMVDAEHPDFSGRITIDPSHGGEATVSDHGTHVAGTVGGDGRNSAIYGGTANQWRGVAYGSQIVSYPNDWAFFDTHRGAIENRNVVVSSNSWGGNFTSQTCDTHNDYSFDAMEMDQIADGVYGKTIVVSVAASNFRDGTSDDEEDPYPICDFSDQPPFLNYFSLSDLGSAKNIITVGASVNDSADSMAYFSSWGPTLDGRLKPDVVAPGYEIVSTFPGGGYGEMSGTSMATPHISGVAALVIQRYRTVFNTEAFRGETIKALLIQTAKDLVGSAGVPFTQQYYRPGPDYASGYGIVDALAAYNAVQTDKILEGQLNDQGVFTQAINVPSADTPVKVTLVWNDPASEPNAAGSLLINDLDLQLVDPSGGVHLPWVLDPSSPSAAATRGADNLNTVEQVQVDSPAVGMWTLRVTGAQIVVGPQNFSVVVNASAVEPTATATPTPTPTPTETPTPSPTPTETPTPSPTPTETPTPSPTPTETPTPSPTPTETSTPSPTPTNTSTPTPTSTPSPTSTPTSTPSPTSTPTPTTCERYDFNDDGVIDLDDINIVLFNSIFVDAPYDAAYDVIPDGIVDIADIFEVALHFGEICSTFS